MDLVICFSTWPVDLRTYYIYIYVLLKIKTDFTMFSCRQRKTLLKIWHWHICFPNPDPCSCWPKFDPLLLIFPFVFIITGISHQMAMRNLIDDVADVQFLQSRHQLSMLRYWMYYISVTVHAALKIHILLWVFGMLLSVINGIMLFWVISKFCWIISMLLWVNSMILLNHSEVYSSARLTLNVYH